MSIVDIDGEKYLKAPLNGWDTFIEIDPFFISGEVTHLVFTTKYKSGTSGYTPEQTTSFFQFLPSDWSENVNDNPHSSSDLASRRIPFNKPSGMSCGIIQLAGRETVSGNWNVLTGDTIFLGKVRTYSNDPTAIFDPNYYENVDMPVGMSIVQIENERYLQVITNGWSSILSIPKFEISQGYSATCNVKYSMGNATADTLNQNQIQSMIVLIDNENTIPNPWGEGEIEARLTLVQNPAPSEMANMSGEFFPEMQYVHNVQFAGQQTVSWGPTNGDTLWVGKIEHIYIVPPPPSHIEVLKTTIAPMLDGVEEQCWNGVEAVPLAQNFVGEDPTVNAYWKAMWADSGLFVLVNVQDDNHFPAWEAGSFETWTYDLSDVALDVNAVLDDGLGAQHNQGHYQHSGVFLEELCGSPIQNGIFTYANQLSGENRITEYYIPFSEMQNKNGNFLNKDSLLLLDAIGFDVCVTDQDQRITDRRHRKVWQNTGTTDENWANMDDAGTIQLIDAPVRLSDSVLVTFRVDMRDEAIGSMGVNLRGSFNGWTSDYPMTCTYDKVYEITLELPKNQYFEYKFRNGEMWESPEGDCNAGGDNTNRTLNVASENLILDLVCYNSCFLCPPSYIEVARTESAPDLDGIIDNIWDAIDAVPIAKNFIGENPTVDAYWKAMWDNQGIYVLINVQDDNHFPAWEDGGNDWEYDHVEVFFDVNQVLDDNLGAGNGQGHYVFSPTFGEDLYDGEIINGLLRYANKLYGESYISEMFFPFALFTNKDGQNLSKSDMIALDAIGFDIHVVDQDQGITTSRNRKVWQNVGTINENYFNMNDAGTIRLIGDDPYAPTRSDSLALVALFNSTGGSNWNQKENWLTGTLDTWQNVTVENGRVVGLNFGWDNNMVGTLPNDIGNLTAIKWFIASGNNDLTGSIPAEIGNLSNLETLAFYNCNLTGTIPDEILNLHRLQTLELSFNNFNAAPMPDFGQLTQLQNLTIEECNFTGDIPAGLSDLTQLQNIYLSNNPNLNQGPIPELSACSELRNFGMYSCNRNGTVPLWLLQSTTLTGINISGNSLTGTLPTSFANRANIRELDLAYNFWDTSAAFPNFSEYTSLQRLRLTSCNVSGAIPACLADLPELNTLQLSNNMLSGSIPSVLASKPGLLNFEIGNNQFTFTDFTNAGILPGNFQYFEYSPQANINLIKTENEPHVTFDASAAGGTHYIWYRDGVEVTGQNNSTLIVNKSETGFYHCLATHSTYPSLTIFSNPSDVGILTQGVYTEEYDALVAFYNALNGNNWANNTNWLSTEPVSTWTGIEVINNHVTRIELPSNNLSGNMPAEIGNLSSLLILNLANNAISSLPPEFGTLSQMTTCDLNINRIPSLPSTIGQLDNLVFISLDQNQLTEIPEEITGMASLMYLRLAMNEIDELPLNIGDISTLAELDLYNNKLTELPISVNNLLNLTLLSVGENRLSVLPKLGALSLINAYIDYNNLTFSAIQNSSIHASGNFYYGNQDKIEATTTDNGTGFTLDVSNAGAENYQWFKNGVIMPDEVSATLTVSGYGADTYHCIMTHTAYPDLTLESQPQGTPGYLTQGIITAEYNALIDLYNACNGDNWYQNYNWLSGADISQWAGIQVSGVHVSGIYLSNNNLNGDIPTSFKNLTQVNNVDLSNNQLTGLPDLSALTQLTTFFVYNNALDFYDLEATSFSQPLTFDFQYYNQHHITASRTENTGQITFTVPDAGGLWHQWLRNGEAIDGENSPSITVDDSDTGYYYCVIANNDYPNLTLQTVALEVGQNILTCGILTTEYQALEAFYYSTGGNLWYNNTNWLSVNPANTWRGLRVSGVNVLGIDLGFNNLIGGVPGEISQLTHLISLQLRGNKINNVHPGAGNMPSLELLDLAQNEFTSFQTAITNFTNLRWLYLDDNKITSTIPESVGNLNKLWDLYLSNNQLEGTLPASMGNMNELSLLFIENNNVSGPFPSSMGNIPTLSELYISGNRFHHSHIEEVMNWPNYPYISLLKYDPQQLVGLDKTIYTQEGNTVELLIENYTVSNNDRYQWYKDDVPIEGAISPILELPNVTMANDGNYFCIINNIVTSSLTLQSWGTRLYAGSIGLVGTINDWGVQSDVPFVQSSANPELWQLEYIFNDNAEVKFRFNNDWSNNWGGDSFPEGSMESFGNNIVVPAGNYSIELDLNAMTYRFTNQTISDSLALVTLYNATGGENWNNKQNWLTGPLHTWENVTVENGRVVGLNLGWDNNMVGTLPNDIGNLTAIKWFIASGNDGLSGPIPTSIGNLTNLETLGFYNCSLTGTIPNEILNLNKLALIELSFNNFGAAPMPNFGQLPLLRNLVVEDCNFTGDIPAGLSNLTLLENVYLNGNSELNAGAIPDFSSSTNIINLGMAGCNRTGTIPAWISQLVNLETLNLSGNSLTGNLPSAFSNAAYIRELDLSWNQFSVALLPDYGSFERLESLILAGCNLTGTIPAWLTTLTTIINLNISYNMLEGFLPENIGNLTSLQHLNIEANRLGGAVPASINNMSDLREFYLNNNQLSGNMPVMSGLTELFILRNSNNKFTFANIAATGRVPGDITHFVYSPQDTILGIEQDGNTLTALDCGHANNVINWYRDGELISTDTGTCEADQTGNYSFTVSNTVFNFLTLYSDTLYVEVQSIPINLPVNNFTLPNGQTDCFNAQNEITVAGTSTVTIENNANATFIAGHSIRFLPGFHAQEGSFVDAHITTTGSFCDDLPAPIMAAEPVMEKSATEPIADENENQPSSLNACMKVYPNPNNGQFTVTFDNFDNETKVYVYNTFGQKVYQTSTWEKFTVVELQHVRRGIYFVKAINNQRHYEQKIIVQ